MTLRHIILAALAAAAVPAMLGAPITPAEALARLNNDAEGSNRAPARVRVAPRLVNTVSTTDGQPAIYVFEAAKGPGYMVLSADDCAMPLLGYSDEGALVGDSLPPALEWWLQEYSKQIQWLNDNGLKAQKRSSAERPAIAPMLTTEWDQGEPFNNQCPLYGTQRTYTGCVATAMAQVMNYWKYPEKGKGTITYQSESIQKRLSLDLSLRKFDWDNMLDIYADNNWTEEQANAVAYLMKAAGFSVRMDYGIDSSGALAMNIAKALKRYFNYDPNLSYEIRACYSLSQWEEMIYNNLRDCGPILYGGGSYIGGGHSFVCDGYDGNGYFHFNWGWTGMSNGYFSLDALDPSALGTGGGAGGGYNFTQDIVLGIQPPTGEPAIERPATLIQQGSLEGSVSGDSLAITLVGQSDAMWVNYNPETLKVEFGARIMSTDTSSPFSTVVSVSNKRFQLAPGNATGPSLFDLVVDLPKAGLADGNYDVSIVIRDPEVDGADWVSVVPAWGFTDHFTLSKEGNSYTVNNIEGAELVVVSSKVIGGLIYGITNRFSITVQNPTDIELSRGFAPCIAYDNSLVMLGESIMLTVPAGQTVTREWTTPLYLLDQNFNCSENLFVTLLFLDETTYNIHSSGNILPLVLKPNPGTPTLSTAAPVVINATSATETVDGQDVIVYNCDNRRDIQISADVTLKNGTFAYPMYACLASPNQDDPTQIALDTYGGHTVFYDAVGETKTFTTSLSFPQAVSGQIYRIMMAYAYGSNLIQIGPNIGYVRFGTSGVEDVAADAHDLAFNGHSVVAVNADAQISIYSASGTLVATGLGEVDTTTLAPGIYIAISNGKVVKFHNN